MTIGFSKMLQTEALPVKSLFPIRTNVEILPQGILPVILITTFVTVFSQKLRNLGTCCITDTLIPTTTIAVRTALKSTNYTDNLVTDKNDI